MTGDALRIMRLGNRLRQADVAERVGLSRQRIAQLEAMPVLPADVSNALARAILDIARERASA